MRVALAFWTPVSLLGSDATTVTQGGKDWHRGDGSSHGTSECLPSSRSEEVGLGRLTGTYPRVVPADCRSKSSVNSISLKVSEEEVLPGAKPA
jgi:hypothetical protein